MVPLTRTTGTKYLMPTRGKSVDTSVASRFRWGGGVVTTQQRSTILALILRLRLKPSGLGLKLLMIGIRI
jgi:hypothetical protein